MEQIISKYSDIPVELQNDILAFLQEPRRTWMLAGAAEVSKPPVGAIEREFGEEFAARMTPEALRRRTKMFIGAAVKEILRPLGYEWVSDGHAVSGSGFFTNGSKYRHR